MRHAIPLLVLLIASACVRSVSSPPETSNLPRVVRSIAVLPAGVMRDSGVSLTSPQTIKTMEDAAVLLDQILVEVFAANPKVRLLSEEEVTVHSQSYTANPVAQALEVGKAVGAEAVMLWGLERYAERSGGDYGVQTPSSVAFQYRLIYVKSGQTLCAASFDETQQSASTNLLDFKTSAKRGFKWVPASVLLQEGVVKKIVECEYLTAVNSQEDAVPAVDEKGSDDALPLAATTEAVAVPLKPPPVLTQEVSSPAEVAVMVPPDNAVTPAPVPSPDALNEGISQFIEEWRRAWEATAGPRGDIDHYGAFYAADFTSARLGRDQWLVDKKRKNAGKNWIRLTISDVIITKIPEDSTWEARFVQKYTSSNYSETSQKKLVLRRSGNNWEIIAER